MLRSNLTNPEVQSWVAIAQQSHNKNHEEFCYALLSISKEKLSEHDFQPALQYANIARAYLENQSQEFNGKLYHTINTQIKQILRVYQIEELHTHLNIASLLETLREKISSHREKIKKQFASDLSIAEALQQNSQFFIELTKELWQTAAKLADLTEQDHYALLGLGSMAKNEMCPYSDIELAILIQDENPPLIQKLKAALSYFEFFIMALGETPTELNIPGLPKEIIPRGFYLDQAGGLSTQHNAELLTTPSKLAALQLIQSAQGEQEARIVLRHNLRSSILIEGSQPLFTEYKSLIVNHLNKDTPFLPFLFGNKSSLRMKEALALLQHEYRAFESYKDNQDPIITKQIFTSPLENNFNIKSDIFGFMSRSIQSLALYYGIYENNTADCLEQLKKKGYLSKKTYQRLLQTLNHLMELRWTTHEYYKSSCEKLFVQEQNSTETEKKCYFNQEKIHLLTEAYRVLIPWHKMLGEFIKSEGKIVLMATDETYDPTNILILETFARLYCPDQAEKWYHIALESHELTITPHTFTFHLNHLLFNYRQLKSIESTQDIYTKLAEKWLTLLLSNANSAEEIIDCFAATPLMWRSFILNYLQLNQVKTQDTLFEKLKKIPSDKAYYQQNVLQFYRHAEPFFAELIKKSVYEAFALFHDEGFAMIQFSATNDHQKNYSHLLIGVHCLFRIYEKRQEEWDLMQKSMDKNLNDLSLSLCKHSKDSPFYIKIYQSLPIPLRRAFREKLLIEAKNSLNNVFLHPILKDMHLLPDQEGHRALWEMSKKNWRQEISYFTSPTSTSSKVITVHSPFFSSPQPLSSLASEHLFDGDGNWRGHSIDGSQPKIGLIPRVPLFFKPHPEMPGMTYLIELLHMYLIGHGTTMSELIRMDIPGKPSLPILISKTIDGISLQEVLTNEELKPLLEKLNRRYFTELVFVAMLSNPEDGLPSNYIVEKLADGTYTLVSVDHDHALFPTWMQTWVKDHWEDQLQVKTILFCLPQMLQKIESKARDAFLEISPEKILRSLLLDAQTQNQYYRSLFDKKTIADLYKNRKGGATVIPIPLKAGDVRKLYLKIQRLQTILRSHPDISLLQCLYYMAPRVGLAYENSFHLFDDPISRLAHVGQYQLPNNGKLVTQTPAIRTLQLTTTLLKQPEYQELADLNPEEGLAELDLLSYQQNTFSIVQQILYSENEKAYQSLLADLRHRWSDEQKELLLCGDRERNWEPIKFDRLSPSRQQDLLEIMYKTTFSTLRIINCHLLDAEILTKIFIKSPDLLELEISNDNEMKGNSRYVGYRLDLHSPTLEKLTLRRLASLGVVELYCPRLKQLKISQCFNYPEDIDMDWNTYIQKNITEIQDMAYEATTTLKQAAFDLYFRTRIKTPVFKEWFFNGNAAYAIAPLDFAKIPENFRDEFYDLLTQTNLTTLYLKNLPERDDKKFGSLMKRLKTVEKLTLENVPLTDIQVLPPQIRQLIVLNSPLLKYISAKNGSPSHIALFIRECKNIDASLRLSALFSPRSIQNIRRIQQLTPSTVNFNSFKSNT